MSLINALGKIGAGTATIVGVGAVVLLLVGAIAYAALESLFGESIALFLTVILLILLLGIASE